MPRELGSGTQNVASDGATPTANNIQFNGIDANNLAENSAATAEDVTWAPPFLRRTRSRSFVCRRQTSMPRTDAERARMSIW